MPSSCALGSETAARMSARRGRGTQKANALPNPEQLEGLLRKSLIIRPIANRRRNAQGLHPAAGLNPQVNPVTKM